MTMAPNSCSFENFENLHFRSRHNESFFNREDERNPDENLFNELIIILMNAFIFSQMRLTVFFLRNKNSGTINAVHVNIRSLSKNFDNNLDILRDNNYSVITETWCMDSTLKNNSNLYLLNFDIISQERKTNKLGVGVSKLLLQAIRW